MTQNRPYSHKEHSPHQYLAIGRPPRALIRAALRRGAMGDETQEEAFALVCEGMYHIPVDPNMKIRSYTTKDLDQRLVDHLVNEEESAREEWRGFHRDVIRNCYEKPTYLNPYIIEAQKELTRKLLVVKQERSKTLKAALRQETSPELEQRAYTCALARVYEEGHCFSNEVPEEYIEEARVEVAKQACAEKLKQVQIQQEMIDTLYATFNTQVLGLAIKKAILALKQKKPERR